MANDVAMPNDVGAWGDKDTRGAWPAEMTIAGEKVTVAKLPKFGDDGPAEKPPARAPVRSK